MKRSVMEVNAEGMELLKKLKMDEREASKKVEATVEEISRLLTTEGRKQVCIRYLAGCAFHAKLADVGNGMIL